VQRIIGARQLILEAQHREDHPLSACQIDGQLDCDLATAY